MSSVVIRSRTLDEEVEATTEIVQLQIFTKQEDWEGVFDQIEVWRSTTTSQGPFEELTDEGWKPARIPDNAPDAPTPTEDGRDVVIVGSALQMRVDGTEDILIVFTGTDPLNYGECATQVTDQSAGRLRSYVTSTGVFVVETVKCGTGAVLEVIGGDAAPLLGLSTESPDNVSTGRDSRINLIRGTEEYFFTDLRGSKNYYYRTRFRNRNTLAVSEFSLPFDVRHAPGVSTENLVCGYLDLVRGDGRPLGNQQVKVYNPLIGELVEGKLVTGPQQTKLTDQNGHVEFNLVRGVRYTIAVTGTDLVREIVAPTDTAVKLFPLLGENIGTTDDVFKVQVPTIVYAERRTL